MIVDFQNRPFVKGLEACPQCGTPYPQFEDCIDEVWVGYCQECEEVVYAVTADFADYFFQLGRAAEQETRKALCTKKADPKVYLQE